MSRRAKFIITAIIVMLGSDASLMLWVSSSAFIPMLACFGGSVVFLGLVVEKDAEEAEAKRHPKDLIDEEKRIKRLAKFGWVILMCGIGGEIIISGGLAVVDVMRNVETAKAIARNDPRNADIFDMSATVDLAIKGTTFTPLTNWDNRWIARMALGKTNAVMSEYPGTGLISFTGDFDVLDSDRFVKDEGVIVVGPDSAVPAIPVGLRFHSFNFRAIHGWKTPVKSLDDVKVIRLELNFVPHGQEIAGGAVDLVVNGNIHKRMVIFPQADTNNDDGTVGHPYVVFATNAPPGM